MNLAEIEAQRAAAQAELAAAEESMRALSDDPREFAKAKRERQAAKETLERLDWAEQAERQRLDAEAKQARSDKLREVQEAAKLAHQEARRVSGEMVDLAARLVGMLKALQAAQERVNVAVSHETYAQRDGLLTRATLEARVAVDRDAALNALRAAQELCILAGMSRQAADQQAAQRRL